jgi:hypothetical protein
MGATRPGHAKLLAESDLNYRLLAPRPLPVASDALAELLLFLSAGEGQLLDC